MHKFAAALIIGPFARLERLHFYSRLCCMTIRFHPAPRNYTSEEATGLYRLLVRPRLVEERMLALLRQGKISKWFSGIGQEAISVGVTAALKPSDYILPLHRNLGVFTTRNVPVDKLVAQWEGKPAGFTQSRDRTFHFGAPEFRIIGMISHLGAMLPVADGVALGALLKQTDSIAVVFSGDGGTSEGDFHEAVNIAAVWNLPVIFLIENNCYGLSTPVAEQYRCERLVDRAAGYGIEGLLLDGNNVLEVHSAFEQLAADLRKNPRAVLVECETFRMRGHEEASGTKYVPQALFEEWKEKDPILRLEKFLISEHNVALSSLESIRESIRKEVAETVDAGMALPPLTSVSTEKEIAEMFAPSARRPRPPSGEKTKKRFVDAIQDALRLALREYPNLIIMGQDIAEYGGVFKATEGFVEEFGKDRIRNTPICESAVLGMSVGLSAEGIKSVIEMQFADFASYGITQIANNIAKTHYRWGLNVDTVIRMPTGAGTRAGPFHSQSNEAWYCHVPGLKVVYPSTPYDAKGLLLSAIDDPNPVLYFEHKGLYRTSTEEIPTGYYNVPIGEARVVQEGDQIGVITYGMGVHYALDVLKSLPEISAYLLDLRTLSPLDYEAIEQCVQATSRVIVLHEDTLSFGIGAEIAAWIAEHCFQYLDAPVVRCASLDTAVPFNALLEDNFLPKGRFAAALKDLLAR